MAQVTAGLFCYSCNTLPSTTGRGRVHDAMPIDPKIAKIIADGLARHYGSQVRAGEAVGLAQQTIARAAQAGRVNEETWDVLAERWTELGLGPSREFLEARVFFEARGVPVEVLDEVSMWPVARSRDILDIVRAIANEVARRTAMTG